MEFYKVVANKHGGGTRDELTYHCDEKLEVGTVVKVPYGKSSAIAVILGKTTRPDFKTKPIETVLYKRAVPQHLLQLSKWISEYYSSPLPTLVNVLLPSGVDKKRRSQPLRETVPSFDVSNKSLTNDQKQAINDLKLDQPGTKVLHGVTGSGKTQIYIELVKKTLAQNKSSIVLVPEIALTSQLIAALSEAFDEIVLTHSKMTEAQKHAAWENVYQNPKARVIVGPRSALFMPVSDLGLIIVDEFHDSAYKQEQSPKYSAVRVASQYAKISNAAVILGSATPPVEDYFLALSKNAPLAKIAKPVSGQRNVKTQIIDMGQNENKSKNRLFSKQLVESIDKNLELKQQIMLFHNRRGTASLAVCESCGHIFVCPRCSTQLTLHADKHLLKCHTCNFSESVPTSCPECKHHTVLFRGFGTKQIEDAAKKLFPKAKIARFDADTPAKMSLANRYSAIAAGKIDIIIGTQMIAKGFDFPKLHTVGIMMADTGLRIPDYTAAETTFQLLHQVAGRVGRRNRQDEVIVQTYNPNHPAIRFGLQQDFDAFYKYEIEQRQKNSYPPFVHLLNIVGSYSTESGAQKAGLELAKKISGRSEFAVLGPAPAFYTKRHNKYRWHIVVKSKSRGELAALASELPSNWQPDLDPSTLL